jgi:hypothetical protein
MDFDKALILLQVMNQSAGHPNFKGLHDAAVAALNDLSNSPKSVAQTASAPSRPVSFERKGL